MTNGRVNGTAKATTTRTPRPRVTCPQCNVIDRVWRAGGVTLCRQCGALFRVNEVGEATLIVATESPSATPEPSAQLPAIEFKLELAVLGCCLLDRDAFSRLRPLLKSTDFAAKEHQIAWDVFSDMDAHDVPIDGTLFVEMARKVGVFERLGGESFVRLIAESACATTTVTRYAEIILEHSAARQSQQIADQFLREAASGKRSPGELVKALTKRLLSIEYVEQQVNTEDDLVTHPLPQPMADAAFYGPAGEAARFFAPESEACAEGIYVNLLTMLGHLIGTRPHVLLGSATHRCNLFSGNTGMSGVGRKGTNITDGIWMLIEAGQRVKFSRGLTSGEGLIGAVNRQHGPVFCLETEFGGTLKCMGRKNNNMADVLKQAWDGPHLSILTKSEPVECDGAFVSMISQMTYGAVRSLFSSADIESGLANRYLWVHTYQGQILERRIDWADLKKRFAPIAERLKAAIQWAQKETSDDIPMLLTDEAEDFWFKGGGTYRRLCTPRMGMYGIATQRRAQQVMRVAMNFAVLDCLHTIGLNHLTAALALWDYCDATAAHIWGSPQLEGDVEKIIEVLKAEKVPMVKTEINRRAFGGHKAARELERLLIQAQATGKVVYTPPAKTGGAKRHEWVYRD
jgi:DnaB-like helicase N terminal domain/Protein of unknown function (DUF3987)